MVLLEDLGKEGWSFPAPLQNSVSRADAEDIVTEMATYHAAFWESRRFSTDLSRLQPALDWQENLNRKIAFEKRTLTGLERARDIVPSELYARRAEIYPAFMRSLELHRQSPETLLHQDLHLGNWLRDADGRMGLYDWQCVARGHWALDYSYALACGLSIENRRNWEKDLLGRYLDRLADKGVPTRPTFEEAWKSYRQQPMHALAFGLFTWAEATSSLSCNPETTLVGLSSESPNMSSISTPWTPSGDDIAARVAVSLTDAGRRAVPQFVHRCRVVWSYVLVPNERSRRPVEFNDTLEAGNDGDKQWKCALVQRSRSDIWPTVVWRLAEFHEHRHHRHLGVAIG